MKYGEQFEKESVPEWSLHNIDYNSLKHHIKVHTTKDQATAIAIPGHQDVALGKFEDELFAELCRQHDRVDMFVRSKSDEISRRLQHLSSQIRQLMLRCATSTRTRMSLKRQRKFSKYEAELLRCGDELQALQRFVNAQVIAFRKILKKYRKWTGSNALGSRFRDTVLSHPKSFTRRDFSPLQSEYEDLLATLRAASPAGLQGAGTPSSDTGEFGHSTRRQEGEAAHQQTHVSRQDSQQDSQHSQGYWNEYEYGSEAGDLNADGGYAIYIDPNQESDFPGIATVVAFFTMPVKKLSAWMESRKHNHDGERASLLPTHTDSYGTTRSFPDISFTDTEDETVVSPMEERRGSYEYASSEDFPSGYETHYASLPSIDDQRMAHYREQVLGWGTVGSFAASLVLLAIAAVLILTGRHKLRLEVDAGVTAGVMASLLFACAGLGMTFLRQTRLGLMNRITVWITFTAICILNGMLLVLVVGNTTL